MKKIAFLLLLLAFNAAAWAQSVPTDNLEVKGIPKIPASVIQSTERYVEMRSSSFAGWDRINPGMYIHTRLENTNQLYHLGEPGGELVQVTDFDEPLSGVVIDRREGQHGLYFTKDIGGGEAYQIYYLDRTNGTHTMLTDGMSRNGTPVLTESGTRFAYASNRRNGTDTDVWIMDPEQPGQTHPLTDREGAFYPVQWSPDESKLIVMQYISANVSRLYIADTETNELTNIRDDDMPEVSFGGASWGAEGKAVYYSSDEGGEYKSIYRYDPVTRVSTPLFPDSKWDVDGFNLSHDKTKMVYIKNEDGMSVAHLVDLSTTKDETLSQIPIGVLGSASWSMDDDKIAFTIQRPVAPGDVYVMDVAKRTLQRWTDSAPDDMGEEKFVEPALVHYPTFDMDGGKPREIPAFVYKPKSSTRSLPVIIDIHGGPEGQYRPWFSSTTQYWVNELGCAVIQPNVRGSSGYGKTYLALDNGFNREHSVQDIGALLDWIATQPDLDKHRVAVYGGSYGGYMVLASMAAYPGQITCGVDVVGISNFVTFLENTGDYRRDLRRVEYGDERDPAMREFLLKISPTSNAHKIASPLFVAQGENDPRVPASEARQIIAKVEANAVPVWSLFAKDEGHGFAKKNNRDYFTRATVLFWKKFLIE